MNCICSALQYFGTNQESHQNFRIWLFTNPCIGWSGFEREEKGFIVILGSCGAENITLLNMVGGIDTSTSGEVIVDGAHLEEYSKGNCLFYASYL